MTITELRNYFNLPTPSPTERPCLGCGKSFTSYDKKKNWFCEECKKNQSCEEVPMDEAEKYWDEIDSESIDIDPEWWDYQTSEENIDDLCREVNIF